MVLFILSLLARMAIRMIWAKIFLVYGALYAMFVQCSSSLDVIGNVATAKRNWRDTSRSHRQPISTVMYRVSQKGPGRIPTVGKMLALVLLCMLSQSKCRHSLHRRSHVVVKIEMFGIPHVCIQRRTTHTAHVHFGKNISVNFQWLVGKLLSLLAKTVAERSVDNFCELVDLWWVVCEAVIWQRSKSRLMNYWNYWKKFKLRQQYFFCWYLIANRGRCAQ